ncbi:lithostathine-1-like [Neocloeon triangulifer]|uniref:lithostathine-1-like n=1 Tax=Neocloeon triangulifer TaxID=2078957 RepID=UPI00286F84AA|nr:lithostathine-1-like [Neocloeon triangulifer]
MMLKVVLACLLVSVTCAKDIRIELTGNYYFSTDIKSWYDARIFCSNNNLELASVQDEAEASLIQSLAPAQGIYWTSGTDLNNPNGNFFWSSGAAIEHSNPMWAAGEPNDYLTAGTEVCVSINTNTGKIQDSLFWEQYKYICESV